LASSTTKPVLGDPLKAAVREHYDRLAPVRDDWYRRNGYYHGFLEHRLADLIPPGSSVLELGCATGNLLAALRPSRGLGLDLSPAMLEVAAANHPGLEFSVADVEDFRLDEKFDFVVASDLVGDLGDIIAMLESVQRVCDEHTRLVLTFHNPAFEGLLRAMQRMGAAMRPSRQNWVGPEVAENMLTLADFAVVRHSYELLVPTPIPGLASFANRRLSSLRPFRYLNLVNLVVARPVRPRPEPAALSCTVLIPCRNEVGNVEAAIERTPEMGSHTEILFVDGSSTDGTREKIEEMIEAYRGRRDIKLLHQVPESPYDGPRDRPDAPTQMLKLGKGDAVRKGFDAAGGDVLMILDADLTVPPEELPRFFDAIATGKGELINGSRLVYPMEARAMRFVNYLGNWFFSVLFSWLLEQPIRDTLCGTKVLRKRDYARIKQGRSHFGDFDPFGDFDLLFGAAWQRLKIIEVPVRYRRRLTGVSKVRVSRHGWLLLGMSLVGFRRLKLAKWLGGRAEAGRAS
jgi:glycosyltransferase involved in cell wall biosynthesis/SAM-dependent methyltransferase